MPALVYFVQPAAGGPVKIGFTENLAHRLEQLTNDMGTPWAVLHTLPGGRSAERAMHVRFGHLRIGRSEQFQPGPELLAFIGRPPLTAEPAPAKHSHYNAVQRARYATAVAGPGALALKAARLAGGLTMEQLAEATGTVKQYVSAVERGARPATLEFLTEVAHALGLAPSELDARLTDRKGRA